MDERAARTIWRWNAAAYCCAAAALTLVLAITVWGAYIDFYEVRATLLAGELNRGRSHAIRTVARIQDQLSRPGASLESAVRQDDWLRQYWNKWMPTDESRLYAAVVDDSGRVLLHSKPALEGGLLSRGWYTRVIDEVWGGDVGDAVETHDPRLTGGKAALDVRVPIVQRGVEVANYHWGMDADWFRSLLAEKYGATRARWGAILAVLLSIMAAASLSLYTIVRRTLRLREAIEVSRLRQLAEFGELVAGIACEIRNPINAIRLNLFALQRLGHPRGADEEGESADIIAEATREIERVEGLMRMMLGYARPGTPNEEDLEVCAELDALLRFIRPMVDDSRICIRCRLSPGPLYIRFDRARFRQIMLNVLNNARQVINTEGEIDISVSRRGRDAVEIAVADTRRGVSPADFQRIFDPLYSGSELGAGLGLALVKRFVEEAGGEVTCESNGGDGVCFRLSFPRTVPDAPALASPHLA